MTRFVFFAMGMIVAICQVCIATASSSVDTKKNDAIKSNETGKNLKTTGDFETINKSLALVNGKVITLRQVEAYQEVKKLINDTKKILNELSDNDILGTYLVDHLLGLEAEQFGLAKISQDELQLEYSEISSKIKNSVKLTGLKLTETEVIDIISTVFKSKTFLEFKISNLESIVGSLEIEEEYKRNRNKYAAERGKALLEIQMELKQRRSMDQIQQWVLFLKRKYKVQFLK